MVHGWASLVQVSCQLPYLFLHLRQGFVGFQQLGKGFRIPPEAIVILRHAVDGELTDKKLEAPLLENVLQRLNRPLSEVSIRRDIYLFDPVVLNEEPADFGEFSAQEGFAAGEVQVLDPPQISRQRENLLHFQIVPLIEISPVKAVLTSQIANGVDKQNQKGRSSDRWKSEVLPSKLTVPDDTFNCVHRLRLAARAPVSGSAPPP